MLSSLNTSGAVGGNVAKTPAETSVVVAGRASLVVLKIKMDSFNNTNNTWLEMSLPWVMIKSNPAPSTYCRQGWLDSTCCKRGYRWGLTGWHFFPAKLSGVGLWSVSKMSKIYKRSHFRSIRIFEIWRLRSLINAKSISWRDHRKNVWIDASVSDRSVFPSKSQSSTTLFFIFQIFDWHGWHGYA